MPVVYDDEKVIRPGVQHNWTKEMLQEYVKCAKSVKYFALNHCKVFSVKGGLVPLSFRDYQMKMFDLLEKEQKIVALWPRQSGKCGLSSTMINVRNKTTGEIREIAIGEFYKELKN